MSIDSFRDILTRLTRVSNRHVTYHIDAHSREAQVNLRLPCEPGTTWLESVASLCTPRYRL